MKALKVIIVALALVGVTNSYAADTSVASFDLSGNVPAAFSVTARGYPGELDLGTLTQVNNRLVGILHFRYNMEIASLEMASSTASGRPENAANVAYAFGAAGFFFGSADGAACEPVGTAAGQLDGATAITQAGLDILDAAAPNMWEGDCRITASWQAAATVQEAGKYSMTVTVTMVSI